MFTISVNPGNPEGKPFIVVASCDSVCQASMFIFDFSPAQLRKVADDYDAELARRDRLAKMAFTGATDMGVVA